MDTAVNLRIVFPNFFGLRHPYLVLKILLGGLIGVKIKELVALLAPPHGTIVGNPCLRKYLYRQGKYVVFYSTSG